LLRVFVDKLAVANAEGVLTLFLCVLLNWLHFLFYFIVLPYFNEIILKCFVHTMEFLIGFHSDWCHTWSTLLINQVCWKEKKIQVLVTVSCYIQSCNH